ncbi:MAG TPA: nuclear transport factor 2 family protein [Candidatus Methylomirabilis sp.]|nr:nuclear transport factor 2 family protein [Candidatus Methylomirabilis sp.]
MTSAEVVEAWHRTQRTDPRLANDLYLADDVKVLLPSSRPIVGKAAAAAHFIAVANSFKPESFDPANAKYTVAISDGNKVARRGRFRAETKDGQLLDLFVFNLFVVENEKITHFEEYFDTQLRAKFTYAYDPETYKKGFEPESRLL